jgi:two-component system nitrogen regulation sensor histidine kinase NtrY
MAEPSVQEPMAPHPPHRRRIPRWWRRALLTSRRINLFRWLEALAAAALVIMLASSYLAFSRNSAGPLPGFQAAARS